MAISGRLVDCKCAFEAIFNFGDSNFDTGGFWAAFPPQSGPYRMTYFKKPDDQATDGRLMIDFLAQALGLPFLSPYLQSIGSDYRHGANNIGINSSPAKKFPICLWAKPFCSGHSAQPNEAFQG
ncbi:hypothetical protein CsSME_00023780 [Camellia sinensis var. sinensis]